MFTVESGLKVYVDGHIETLGIPLVTKEPLSQIIYTTEPFQFRDYDHLKFFFLPELIESSAQYFSFFLSNGRYVMLSRHSIFVSFFKSF